MGLFDIETKKKKKEEPSAETEHAPQIGAKALQFTVQGETKRMMASGDSSEFEMAMTLPDDGQPHTLVIKVDTVFSATEEGSPEWFVKLYDAVGVVWENSPSADQTTEHTFDVMPGQEKSFTLKITSPTGARYGDKITVLVNASLKENPSINDVVTLQATARQSMLAVKTSIGHEKTVADSIASRAKPKPVGVFAILSPITGFSFKHFSFISFIIFPHLLFQKATGFNRFQWISNVSAPESWGETPNPKTTTLPFHSIISSIMPDWSSLIISFFFKASSLNLMVSLK